MRQDAVPIGNITLSGTNVSATFICPSCKKRTFAHTNNFDSTDWPASAPQTPTVHLGSKGHVLATSEVWPDHDSRVSGRVSSPVGDSVQKSVAVSVVCYECVEEGVQCFISRWFFDSDVTMKSFSWNISKRNVFSNISRAKNACNTSVLWRIIFFSKSDST